MRKNNFYCCSIDNDKITYTNEMFDTFEEAKEKGLEILREYNENLENPDYMPDEDVFDDELVNNFDFVEDVNSATLFEVKLDPVKEFWILEFERPFILRDLGEFVVRDIDSYYWNDINENLEVETLQETLGQEGINELNKLIYDFLDKKTDDYKYGMQVNEYLVKVE